MSQAKEIAIIADSSILNTVCAGEQPDFAQYPRPAHGDTDLQAACLAADGVHSAIIIDPRPGEAEALLGRGIASVAWLIPPGPGPAHRADLARFVAVLATDAESATTAGAERWTLEPLPVCDRLFNGVQQPDGQVRIFFDGPTSERRDRFLQPVKHRFDVLHLVSGADVERHVELMARCSVAIDLIRERGLRPRDRIGPALAAGLLVLAEEPVGRPGLVAGEQLSTFNNPDQLELLISDATREPEAFIEMRRTGREYAERLRSSVVLPRVASLLTAAS